ncbi:cytochrome P450 [Kitasatospora sp. MAP5-34]|uniref:cytochrome P450 n=1 Tax=Kitasatospora sp. MAP5-34 TaxID=3035102 RepID=UPI00247463C2|nr:cytochrome P450 [Kitasatospora sp. MAP5-34]
MIALLTEARELGPISRFRLGSRQTVLVTGPEQVQHILAQHPDRYVKRSHRARLLLGDGVISASGDAWKNQRRLLQAQFTATGVRRHEHRIAGAARRTADRWAEKARTGELTDVGEDMQFFALDTIWRCLTGHPLDAVTHRELSSIEAVVAALPTAAAAPDGGPDAMAADLARIDATAERTIAAAREEAAERPAEEALPDGAPLLQLLLETARTRPEYTDRLIRDELVTVLAAGHETTAKTLSWLFLLLDRHPEAREWVAAADRPGSPVGRKEAIHALVSETLRLYPAVWLIPRHAPEDDLVDGYLIEAGSDVLVCPYLTHRDPELWPDPEHFDPERFLTAGRRPVRPGAYYPFGVGARACLGLQFAMREMAVLLDLLLPAYRPAFRSTPAATVFGANLRPDGSMPARIQAVPPS